MDDDELEDDGEGEYEISTARTNGWTVALIGFQFIQEVFQAVSDLFGALAALSTNKWEVKEEQRAFHDVVTLELESLPETKEGPGSA